jgi:hypothetical protein
MSSATKSKQPVYLSRQQQADRYGVSVRSIKRWGEDPCMNLPPEYEFRRARKRRQDQLEEWERSRIATMAAE